MALSRVMRSSPVLRTTLIEAAIILVLIAVLLAMGRALACRCGVVALWSGDIWSNQNSQQFADAYSFTHITHGVLFFWALRVLWRQAPLSTRLIAATLVEAAWEAAENTPLVINRYREATISLDYYGDSVINSSMDVVFAIVGFLIASRLSGRYAVLGVVAMEGALLLTIRDSLLVNIIMLFYPIEAIRRWQSGG